MSIYTKVLNIIPVFIDGYVAKINASFERDDIRYLISDEFPLGNKDTIIDMTTIHLEIKCPLFVKLMFPEFGLTILTKKQIGKPIAFKPSPADVSANSLEVSKEIADDIKATTDALIINPKAYRTDGCDRNISQLNTPICVYSTCVVSGTLRNWMKLINYNNFPKLTNEYRKTIEGIINSEYEEILNG